MTLRIPDNPECRSKAKFRYDRNMDALTYGWEATNELVEMSEAIIEAVGQHVGSK